MLASFFLKKNEKIDVFLLGKMLASNPWTETKCNNDLTATWEIMVYVRGIIPFYGRKIQVNVKYYNLPRYIIYLHNKYVYIYIYGRFLKWGYFESQLGSQHSGNAAHHTHFSNAWHSLQPLKSRAPKFMRLKINQAVDGPDNWIHMPHTLFLVYLSLTFLSFGTMSQIQGVKFLLKLV